MAEQYLSIYNDYYVLDTDGVTELVSGVVIIRFEVIHKFKPLSMQGAYLIDMYYSYEDVLLEKVCINNTQIFDQNTDMKRVLLDINYRVELSI